MQIFHQIFSAPWPNRKSASSLLTWDFFWVLSCCCYLLTANPSSATVAPPLFTKKTDWELATLLAAQLKAESCFSVEFKLRFGQDHVWVISTKILPKSAFTKVTIFKMKWRFLLVALTFYCSMVGTILLYFWLCNMNRELWKISSFVRNSWKLSVIKYIEA